MGGLKREKDVDKKQNLIWDYIIDSKAIILLFFANALVFVVVCSLYQLHNLPKIMYAFLLSAFVWICYGVLHARTYIQKRKRIQLAKDNLEQAWEALLYGSVHEYFSQGKFDRDKHDLQLTRLDTEYGELIRQLCQLQGSMESDAQMRRTEMMDYYMMWVHQIKTPIAALKLLLNSREDGFQMMEELFKIEQYVEMVLSYLRLESIASDMILKEYDLYTMVKQTVRKYSVLFINSGLTLRLDEFDIKVLTDEKWLGFVLEQLISNSIKYTKMGTVSIYMKPGSEKTLVIEDTGIGIRQEDLPRIFDRGFTGYNGRMDKKSTGIGLYLCKQILNQLSHKILVESKEGEGTRIYLDLSRNNYVEHVD
ncbi:sensor histidine kinase [Mobilitalea sibirica]|uniref:histidine kinase n=2 Tax=Mobilitalea sibirica TaxID=1462919 RepID=A0A8J7H1H1_9FIRM|nr:sensor histidine kinase [Mobilitalea sibirica]